MQQSYPKFNLEDKVVVQEGSIVTRVNNNSKMVGELVMRDGNVASDVEHKKLCKSVWKKRESVKLQDYIQEGMVGMILSLSLSSIPSLNILSKTSTLISYLFFIFYSRMIL